ncbi:hypothetical protein [Kocuria sp. CH-021]|uniref:hypothetical protein n=1 Tax=Kocuria sp. CH-021 TaxID=3406735 RepID=UPI003C765C31
MTHENISSDTSSRREAARTTDGKFGTQPLAEADLELEDRLNLEVVKAALPAGPEATYDRFTYADLTAFTDRLDDPEFFQDHDTYEARVRISVLSSAYADRDRGTNSDAAWEVLALYDVPGGILEGRSLELQSAIDRDLFGYPSGYQVVDRDGRGTGRATLREQHRTMMAALLENHLRFDAPAPMGDPRDLNIHPDQYQDEEMNAAELAEVHRRLSVSRNFSAENTDEVIGKVRKATRGMSLRQVYANDGQATKLTEAGVTNVEPVLSVAGDPTGQVRATTRGGAHSDRERPRVRGPGRLPAAQLPPPHPRSAPRDPLGRDRRRAPRHPRRRRDAPRRRGARP